MDQAYTVIVGLGNPGLKYRDTRHNSGRIVLEQLAAHYQATFSLKFKGTYFKLPYMNTYIHGLMPNNYMNCSGQAVAELVNFYKVSPTTVLVIQDDLDLPEGTLRLKQGGGPGGHNGINHIIKCLQTKDFWRLKIGIGRPDTQEQVHDYVLKKPNAEGQILLNNSIDKIIKYFPLLVEGNISAVQKIFHTSE
jgi:PTH1 family peptidyl-tRNA hydrolase